MADLERATVDVDYALEAIERVDSARERVAERHMMYDMADVDPAGVWTLLHVHHIVASSYPCVPRCRRLFGVGGCQLAYTGHDFGNDDTTLSQCDRTQGWPTMRFMFPPLVS